MSDQVITTSNLVRALDEAFIDRADLLLLLDLPSGLARYEIIRSAVQELLRCGIIKGCVYVCVEFDTILAMRNQLII